MKSLVLAALLVPACLGEQSETGRAESPLVAGGDSADYDYDGHDQLRRVTLRTNGLVTGSEEYVYAGERRVAVIRRDAIGAKTDMIWTLGDTEGHHDAAGAPTHAYSHVSLGTPVARINRTAAATTLEFQFHGLANSTIAAVASTGAVTTQMSYTPFGEVTESVTPQDHQRRFNDKQRDGTDLAYYGVRFYDPIPLAWTQSDPKYRVRPDASEEPRRANLHSFDLGNPLTYLDSDGRDPEHYPPFDSHAEYPPTWMSPEQRQEVWHNRHELRVGDSFEEQAGEDELRARAKKKGPRAVKENAKAEKQRKKQRRDAKLKEERDEWDKRHPSVPVDHLSGYPRAKPRLEDAGER